MGIGYNPRCIQDGLMLYLDAANLRSVNNIFNYINNPNSITSYAANQNVTISQNGQYIQAVAQQNTSTPGVWPIGGLISVPTNAQFRYRVKGFKSSGSTPYLYINGNVNSNLVWQGLPLLDTNSWVENVFNTGSNTQIRVGVLWSAPSIGSTFQIEDVTLNRIDLWNDITGNQRNCVLTNGPTYNSSTVSNRRNLFVYTEEFDNGAIYYRPNALVTPNATTSPRGDLTADFAYANATTGYHGIVQGFTATAGVTYTWSIHVKANQYTKVHIGEGYNGGFYCTVDLATSTIIGTGGAAYLSSTITSLNDGWKRISVTFKTGSTYGTSIGIIGYPDSGATLNVYGAQYTGDGTSGVYIWGIQMDLGAFPTTYQKIDANFIDIDKIPSFLFDGVNDYALIQPHDITAWTPQGSVGQSSITYDLWIKTSDINSYIFTKPWNGGGGYNVSLSHSSLTIGPIHNNYEYTNTILFPSIATGNPINITFWISPTEYGYYINGGILKGSKAHGFSIDNPNNGSNTNIPAILMSLFPYGFGWGGSVGLSAQGNVYQFKVYNRVLSESEVKQNFNTVRSRFGI